MKDKTKKEILVIANFSVLFFCITFCGFIMLSHTTENTFLLAVIISSTLFLIVDFFVLIATLVQRERWQKRYYIITGAVLLSISLTPSIQSPLDSRGLIAFILFWKESDIQIPDLPFAPIYAILKLIVGLLLRYKSKHPDDSIETTDA